MALPDSLLTSSLWKAVLKIFLGFKSVSTWSVDICIFESHNGFCMSLTDAIILNGLWGRPALTIRTLVFILIEWGTERHSSLFLHDSKYCVFPEKCSCKGKDKTSFVSWGYETDKVGWFCFLFLFFIYFSMHPNAYHGRISTVHFCTGMSENGCVYCQENVSFHLEALK